MTDPTALPKAETVENVMERMLLEADACVDCANPDDPFTHAMAEEIPMWVASIRAAYSREMAGKDERIRELEAFMRSVEYIFDHAGAMSATQLSNRDRYRKVISLRPRRSQGG